MANRSTARVITCVVASFVVGCWDSDATPHPRTTPHPRPKTSNPNAISNQLSVDHEQRISSTPQTAISTDALNNNQLASSHNPIPKIEEPDPAKRIEKPTVEDLFLFFPEKFPNGDWQPVSHREDVWLTSADGTKIHAWYYESDQPACVILYSHGNGGNISMRSARMEFLRSYLNASILIYDYRGYGRSEGIPTIAGVLDDAKAALNYLSQRTQREPRQIVLMGRSLGGAISIQLGVKESAQAIVVESTFSSLKDMAKWMLPELSFLVPEGRLNSAQTIRSFRGPFFQSHGDFDHLIPLSQGKKVFEAAHQPKQWFTESGLDHNDPVSLECSARLKVFLEQASD